MAISTIVSGSLDNTITRDRYTVQSRLLFPYTLLKKMQDQDEKVVSNACIYIKMKSSDDNDFAVDQ